MLQESLLTKWPVPGDLCVSDPISQSASRHFHKEEGPSLAGAFSGHFENLLLYLVVGHLLCVVAVEGHLVLVVLQVEPLLAHGGELAGARQEHDDEGEDAGHLEPETCEGVTCQLSILVTISAVMSVSVRPGRGLQCCSAAGVCTLQTGAKTESLTALTAAVCSRGISIVFAVLHF